MTDMVSSAEEVAGLAVEQSLRLSRLSDELLARHAARGSERAFAVLYGRYHEPLYGYCRSIVRNDADAQDALQSTFAAALAALKRRRRNAPLRPWLFRIAHNQAISLIRRRNSEAEKQRVQGEPLVAASAEDRAAERARWALLTADLAELPERLKGALLLRELNGLSHEEIATVLGTTVGGAKEAIFEARQALAVFAEGRAMECEQVRRRLSDGDGRVLRGRLMRAHLRDCAPCDVFAAAIRSRQAELRALTPMLPSAAAAGVLSQVIRSASGHGGSASSASAVSAATTAGAAGKTAGTVIGIKAMTTAAAVLATGAGAIGLTHALRPHRSARPPAAPARLAKRAGSGPIAAPPSDHTRQATQRLGIQQTVTSARPAHPFRGAGARPQARAGRTTRATTRGRGSAASHAPGRSAGSNGHATSAPVRHGRSGSHAPATGHRSSTRSHGAARGPKSTSRAASQSHGKAGQVHAPAHVHKVAAGHRSTPKVKSTSRGHSQSAHPPPGSSTTGAGRGGGKPQVKSNS